MSDREILPSPWWDLEREFFPMRDWWEEMRERMERMVPHRPLMMVPRVNVSETEKEVIVEASVPGIDPKNVDITVSEDHIEIKGERKEEKEEKEKKYYRKEISYGSFYRTIPLPSKVIKEKADAEFSEGMLKITIPKAKVEKPKVLKIKPKIK